MKEEQQFLNNLDKRLWTAADKLRSNLDATVYKHAVLGLIFLKYVSDAFDERRKERVTDFLNPEHDYYLGDAAAELIPVEPEIRNRAIETAQVIEEPIRMAEDFQEALKRHEALALNPNELAFCDGDVTLKRSPTNLPRNCARAPRWIGRHATACEPRFATIFDFSCAATSIGRTRRKRRSSWC